MLYILQQKDNKNTTQNHATRMLDAGWKPLGQVQLQKETKNQTTDSALPTDRMVPCRVLSILYKQQQQNDQVWMHAGTCCR